GRSLNRRPAIGDLQQLLYQMAGVQPGRIACQHTSFSMSHGHGSVENLVNNHAVCSRSIAAHAHVCGEELLFGFSVPLEFKNCRGQIIGGVGDVKFGSAKVMMLEVGLEDCGWCVKPFLGC